MSHQQKTVLFFLSALLLAVVTALVLLNCTPPISRDEMTHHLAIPKLYLAHGTMYEIPELLFSYYPMNLEMLYLIPLAFGNDIIPKFIHLSFGLGTTYLIYRYLATRFTTLWGLTGAILFLSTPIVIRLSSTAYVDLGLTFFATASVFTLMIWSKKNRNRFLVLSGFLAGLAAGTKYNGLITVFLLSCFIPFLLPSGPGEKTLRRALSLSCIFLFCAFLALSPWLVRNIMWTGNPVYPLFQSFFDSQPTPVSQGMNPLLLRKIVYDESILQSVLIPVRIFFQGQDNNPQFFDGVLNPFILLFALLCFIPSRIDGVNRKVLKTFIWYCLLFLLFTFLQRVIRIRYIVPVLPFLVILSIIGLNKLHHFLHARVNTNLAVLLPISLMIIAFSFNAKYLWGYWSDLRPLDYLSGTINRKDFITHFLPEYPVIDYANNNLPENAKILAVFLGNRGYYFDRQVDFDLKAGKSSLCLLGQQLNTDEAVLRALQQNGYTHLIIRQDLFAEHCLKKLPAHEAGRLVSFFRDHTTLAYAITNHSLHQLTAREPRP